MEMLVEMITAILGYIKNGQFSKAEKSLENVYKSLLKEDASFFQYIPLEKLTDTLIGVHHYTNGHLEILAELFFAEAELNFAQKKLKNCLELYQKSLKLFEFLIFDMKIYSIERTTKIEAIKNRIAELKAYKDSIKA
jgi:hypothetical protein